MSVHPDGSGTGWTLVETVDIDQPHGKDYLWSQHIAKGVRKRINKQHVTFADNTVGGEHIPGGASILDIVDQTIDISIDDSTYVGRNLIYDQTNNALWCFTNTDGTSSTPDAFQLTFHPDRAWSGGDVTWAGAHEFDASVDISGNVAMDGDLTIDGRFALDSSADVSDVYVNGDLSASGSLKVGTDFSLTGDFGMDGTANFFDEADFSDINTSGTPIGFVTAASATVFNTSLTSGSTFQDLDLSGTVGSRAALVHLEIRLASAAGSTFHITKTKGFGSATFAEHFQGGGGPAGGCVVGGENASASYGQITLMTDSSGVIQHAFSNATTTITIKLLGYVT